MCVCEKGSSCIVSNLGGAGHFRKMQHKIAEQSFRLLCSILVGVGVRVGVGVGVGVGVKFWQPQPPPEHEFEAHVASAPKQQPLDCTAVEQSLAVSARSCAFWHPQYHAVC